MSTAKHEAFRDYAIALLRHGLLDADRQPRSDKEFAKGVKILVSLEEEACGPLEDLDDDPAAAEGAETYQQALTDVLGWVQRCEGWEPEKILEFVLRQIGQVLGVGE